MTQITKSDFEKLMRFCNENIKKLQVCKTEEECRNSQSFYDALISLRDSLELVNSFIRWSEA